MFNVHDDNKAEIATNMSQAAADAAEKAKLNTPMMNISANNLEHKRVSGKMKKTMDESATPDEVSVLAGRLREAGRLLFVFMAIDSASHSN